VALAVGVFVFQQYPCLNAARFDGATSAIAGVAGVLLGALIMALALLTAVMDRTLVVNMRKTGHYQRLISDTFLTCTFLLLALGLSITCFFFETPTHRWLFSGMLLALVLSALYVVEAGRRFSVIIQTL
jgi:hypothetical protein